MGLVVLVAIELAALQSATREWAEVARLLTVAALVFASYQARYSTGRAGAWWFGFALLGWASYLLGVDATRQWTSFDGYKLDSFLEAIPFRILGLNTPPLEYRLAGTTSQEGTRLYCQVLIIQRISVLFFASLGGLTCLLVAPLSHRRSGQRCGDVP
jgi:hypothetical protein